MLYSLFELKGENWVKISPKNYPLKRAKQVFNPYLIAGLMLGKERALRKVATLTKEEDIKTFEMIAANALKRGKALIIHGRFITFQSSMNPEDIEFGYVTEYSTE